MTTFGRDEHDNSFTQSSNRGRVNLDFDQINSTWVEPTGVIKVATDGKSPKIEFTVHVVRDGDSHAAIVVPYEIFRDTLDAEAITFHAGGQGWSPTWGAAKRKWSR